MFRYPRELEAWRTGMGMEHMSSNREDIKGIFREVWDRVCQLYQLEHIVSERGLQAALYAELRDKLSGDMHIVVEPEWSEVGKRPDLVLCTDNEITDVFELKFVPQFYAQWEEDVEKLLSYVQEPPGALLPVRLDRETGQWKERLPVGSDCRLHFVAVSRHDAEAVWKECLERQFPSLTSSATFHHWYGRVGNGEDRWGIEFPRS